MPARLHYHKGIAQGLFSVGLQHMNQLFMHGLERGRLNTQVDHAYLETSHED